MIATDTIPDGVTLHPTTFYCDPTGGWFRRSPERPFIYIPKAASHRFFRNLASTTPVAQTNREIRGVASRQVLGKDCRPFEPGDMIYLTQTPVHYIAPGYPLDYILETDGTNLFVQEPHERDRLWLGTRFVDERLHRDIYEMTDHMADPMAFTEGTAVKVLFVEPQDHEE